MLIKEIIIALSFIKGMGRKSIYKFLMQNRQVFQNKSIDEEDLLNLVNEYSYCNNRIQQVKLDDITINLQKAQLLIEEHKQHEIEIITIFDKFYPSNLRSLDDNAPVILYAKGNLNLLMSNSFVAVIGSRKISNYAARVGIRLSEIIADRGATIVSGLAIGSDTCGHIGALASDNGKTIAILPTGLDNILPVQNRDLAKQIVEKGSLLLSEYPIGSTLNKGNYIERDRIQAGLSDGIIVLETDALGGTMNAVKIAYGQKMCIGCLPENMVQLSGNKLLINDYSAIPISSQKDIEAYLDKVSLNEKENDIKESEKKTKIEQIKLF